MAKVRVYRGEVNQPVGSPKVRVYRGEINGTVPASTKIRVYRGEFNGVAAVVLNPIAPVTVEPEQVITKTLVLANGATPDLVTWRQISGPTVTLTPSETSVIFRSPSAMKPGATVVLGVTASIGSVTSSEMQVVITVLPQTHWTRVPGKQWVGATRFYG